MEVEGEGEGMIVVKTTNDIRALARDYAEAIAECKRLGHPLAPDEPLAEKIRNLCAIIQSQRNLLDEARRQK